MPKSSAHSNLPSVLLTGFDAFGGDTVNPSWLAVLRLDGEVIAGYQVIARQIPTEFSASTVRMLKLLRQYQPALVICVGQAGGRSALSLERIAINVQDARIADNAGKQPIDVPIAKSGPAAYFSTLPIKSMLQALTNAGISAEVSQTAGTFVCNHLFYALMHALKKQRRPTPARGGFIHVPFQPSQGLPCMALTDIVRGLRVATNCALTTDVDARLGAGSLN